MQDSHSQIVIRKGIQNFYTKEIPISRNPFFIFMHEFRKTHKNIRIQSIIAQKSALKWRKLSKIQKLPYFILAARALNKRKISLSKSASTIDSVMRNSIYTRLY